MDNISQDIMRVKAARFEENGAGTYNFDVFLPAGSMISNILVAAEVLWAAGTSAALVVGDYACSIVNGVPVIGNAIDADGFFKSINLKATDLTQGQHVDFNRPGGKMGDYIPFLDPTAASVALGSVEHPLQLSDGIDRILRFSVASVGAGTTGRTYVAVEFAPPAQVVITQ